MDFEKLYDVCCKKAESSSSSSSSDSSFDSFLWDSSDSDSDFPNDEKPPIQTEDFMQKVVPQLSNKEYKEYFRLDRAVVKYVETLIAVTFESKGQCLDINKSLHFFLWYIGNQLPLCEMCSQFNISESVADQIVQKVAHNIAALSTSFINFPPEQQFAGIAENFKKSFGIVRVIGVMGISHISIKNPKVFSGTSTYTIIMQGICDSTHRFIDISVGEPGCLSQAKVLRKSPIYNTITSNPNCLRNYCILGGQGYPLLHWLVPPFTRTKSDISSGQKQFNNLHSDTSKVIDTAFKILKKRFQRLDYFQNFDKDLICHCLVSVCVLHNICLQMGDDGSNLLEQSDS